MLAASCSYYQPHSSSDDQLLPYRGSSTEIRLISTSLRSSLRSSLVLVNFVTFWAAAPKGSKTYAFTHIGNFLLLLLVIEIWVLRRRCRPEG